MRPESERVLRLQRCLEGGRVYEGLRIKERREISMQSGHIHTAVSDAHVAYYSEDILDPCRRADEAAYGGRYATQASKCLEIVTSTGFSPAIVSILGNSHPIPATTNPPSAAPHLL